MSKNITETANFNYNPRIKKNCEFGLGDYVYAFRGLPVRLYRDGTVYNEARQKFYPHRELHTLQYNNIKMYFNTANAIEFLFDEREWVKVKDQPYLVTEDGDVFSLVHRHVLKWIVLSDRDAENVSMIIDGVRLRKRRHYTQQLWIDSVKGK